MTRSRTQTSVMTTLAAAAFMTACGGQSNEPAAAAEAVDVAMPAPNVAFRPSNDVYDGTVSKPGSPYSISYRIIGTPIVGSPVVVDLKLESALAPRPVNLDYRINDAASMMLAESQPASMRMETVDNEGSMKQQITVIPQREGRLYLNVSASFETDNGTMSTVTAIPIQVGTAGRALQEHGTVQMDENGDAVRVLKVE